MTNTTLTAPAGTINEFLGNLGVSDEEAVHSINVDATGLITVVLKVRGPDGKFLVGYTRDSSLPVNVTATLTLTEEEPWVSDEDVDSADEKKELLERGRGRWDNTVANRIEATSYGEVRRQEGYSTKMALEALDIATSGKAHEFDKIGEEGEKGKLRVFTFARRKN